MKYLRNLLASVMLIAGGLFALGGFYLVISGRGTSSSLRPAAVLENSSLRTGVFLGAIGALLCSSSCAIALGLPSERYVVRITMTGLSTLGVLSGIYSTFWLISGEAAFGMGNKGQVIAAGILSLISIVAVVGVGFARRAVQRR